MNGTLRSSEKQVHREYYLNWGIDVCEMDHIAQGVNLIHNEVRIPLFQYTSKSRTRICMTQNAN
jgi:hypothetical protein